MNSSRFSRANTAAQPRPASPKRRFAGVQAAADRDPMPPAGAFRFRVTAIEEGYNQGKDRSSFKVSVETVETDVPSVQRGGVFRVIFLASMIGMGEFKRFAMAVAGYDDEAAYNEFDPEGLFMEALLNLENRFSQDDQGKFVGNPGVGRLVDVDVRFGKPDGKGDFYRVYSWASVPETDQS